MLNIKSPFVTDLSSNMNVTPEILYNSIHKRNLINHINDNKYIREFIETLKKELQTLKQLTAIAA